MSLIDNVDFLIAQNIQLYYYTIENEDDVISWYYSTEDMPMTGDVVPKTYDEYAAYVIAAEAEIAAAKEASEE
jgi:hypothetical protein